MAAGNPISLRVSHKRAYVWNVDDVAALRSHHHICGVLTGTLPHVSQQNVFLGVPLVLMPEEVVLLVDKGLATLVDDQNAHHDPGVAELARWDLERHRDVEEQLALAEKHDAREARRPDRAMTEEAILKRKGRDERRAHRQPSSVEASHPARDADENTPTHTTATTGSVPEPVDAPRAHRSDVTASRRATTAYTVHVPGPSSTLEWYTPSSHSSATIAAARNAGIWSYPGSPLQRARCAVFRDLWERGYFMGSGIKFGGEYLVYPGDPLRYHSHFIASVIESPEAPLRPMEIVAHGRLGTGTKKAHLLCEWDEDEKVVTYYSVEWAGFG